MILADDLFKKLAIADPKLSEIVLDCLKDKMGNVSTENVDMLVEDAIWGLSVELMFGYKIAVGYAKLLGEVDEKQLKKYQSNMYHAGKIGPTFGKLMAKMLVPVIRLNDNKFYLFFLKTVNILMQKGTYTLKTSFEILSSILESDDFDFGYSYLELLSTVFVKDLTYNQSRYFLSILPNVISSFSLQRRNYQIKQFCKVVKEDITLADPFLDGMNRGLFLLSEKALIKFVLLAIEKFRQNNLYGINYLSLKSELGFKKYEDLQVAVPVSQVQYRLNNYICARTGLNITVRPFSDLSKSILNQKDNEAVLTVLSDGRFIYLPDEIGLCDTKNGNITLYCCLAKFEAAYYEFKTFDFDFEKIIESNFNCPVIHNILVDNNFDDNIADLELFFDFFPIKELASDLFTIFEHGRILFLLKKNYPGLVKNYLPLLQNRAKQMYGAKTIFGTIFKLYLKIALDIDFNDCIQMCADEKKITGNVVRLFEKHIKADKKVEASAALVIETYFMIADFINKSDMGNKDFYTPIKIPFDRKIRPDLYFNTYRSHEKIVKTLQKKIKAKGYKVYKSDIRKVLQQNDGALDYDSLKQILADYCKNFSDLETYDQINYDIDGIENELSGILSNNNNSLLPENDITTCQVFWYKEWDFCIKDYLADHTRVVEKICSGSESDFYKLTLSNHFGLIKKIRNTFELLKPEGLSILRNWPEGDEFDYRALLDNVINKKIGVSLSDRIYIKRTKQVRDFAALLLVDFSRSTSNKISGLQKSIIEIEKEAIVLFCEALKVVGDSFAISGFSGSSRHKVDYFTIKDFHEPLNFEIKKKIDSIAPQQNTRMGSAIRHASFNLEKIPAKIRLMIILSDGFPNDIDYKRKYAIEDTKKAILEARSKNIHTKAITVNLSSDSKLDDMYGSLHHSVISDINDLPGKLLEIYSALTKL